MTLYYSGLPPVGMFIGGLFVDFFFVGILFGNMNSLAMQPLGQVAGIGAALIGAISSAIAVPIALFIDSYLNGTITPIIIGFSFFGVVSLMLFQFAGKSAKSITPSNI
jgi:DHA1 family bicyclomycin/chloramphenicol resistance-like MFS transporter